MATTLNLTLNHRNLIQLGKDRHPPLLANPHIVISPLRRARNA